MNLSDTKYYINRELSWLEFNHRVLEEAFDTTNLLLERLRFLSITASNLDEFFMVRVSTLIGQMATEPDVADASGLKPYEQLVAISEKVHKTVLAQYNCLNHHLLPGLKNEGLHILSFNELNKTQKDFVTGYFHNIVFPILTPMAIDQARPFPLLSNRAIILLVELIGGAGQKYYALLQVPSIIDRFLSLPTENGSACFITLEAIIEEFIGELFPGNTVSKCSLFRITRNSDLNIDEEDTSNLLGEIEQSVRQRKWGKPVRLEIEKNMDAEFVTYLKEYLDVDDNDIYIVNGLLDLAACSVLCKLNNFDHLLNKELKPVPAVDFYGMNVFDAIQKKDILVHHPYESFDCVANFVSAAACDPDVLAIKQTLYRVSGNSPIVKSLMLAAESGKQVTVVVELRARFDEENNISWAKRLEKSGCHVIYGLVGLKIHCKACLVVRKEKSGIKRYVHLGTGNYNDSTAKLYTDLGLFTCKESFGRDISALFNTLTGYSVIDSWNKIKVSPLTLRKAFLDEIRNETENARSGKYARIIAKMNSLVDEEIIRALYEASMAGVEIKLIVRGICCLRSGLDPVSRNISVYSIVGRFLEHSRIYYFENSGDPNIYLSSADWMPRNLNRRVEIAFPIEAPDLKKEISMLLETILADRAKLRIQQSDGNYIHPECEKGSALNSQMSSYYMLKDRYDNVVKIEKLRKKEENAAGFRPVVE